MSNSIDLFLGQLVLGLVNGSFYAMLSLGLAVIFGMLGVVNFAHGALYTAGAFTAWLLSRYAGLGMLPALLVVPVAVGALAAVFERYSLKPLYKIPHIYVLLATFGFALIIQGLLRELYGTTGLVYPVPPQLRGGFDLGTLYLPYYRIFVIFFSATICCGVWFFIEKTSHGMYIRAAAENPSMLRTFGVRVNGIMTLTFAGGAGLAAIAGVVGAPIYTVSSNMGHDLLILIFAVVVIGGLGSIKGPVITAYIVGISEGLAKAYVPQLAEVVVFILMVLILLFRPAGLFGTRA